MTQELFEKVIGKWRRRTDPSEGLTLTQIANLALGNGNSRNTSIVGSTLSLFIRYFYAPKGPQAYKWRVNWTAVQRDYPQLLDVGRPTQPVDAGESMASPLQQMMQALDDEIRAVREEIEKHPLRSTIVQELGKEGDGSFLYEAFVELPRDSELPIPEGVGIFLKWRSYLEPNIVEATLLSYDPINSIIIFEVKQPLAPRHKSTSFDVLPRIEELIHAVKAKLATLKSKPEALSWRLLNPQFQRKDKSWNNSLLELRLDRHQIDAVRACLKSDITFLWGPPGTGKTHTLAHLIVTAALAGHKVIATAIANVAVDQLAIRVIRSLEEHGSRGKGLLDAGRVLRFGHPRLPEVSGEPRLFPNKLEIQRLRKLLHEARLRHRELPTSDRVGRALAQKVIEDLKSELRKVTKETIEQSSIVLTTIVQPCIEPAFTETHFDMMVVDEASMVPIPYLTCMGMIPRERFVIAGDFKQLGPIAVSQSRAAFDWLHKDAFQLVGIHQNSSHSALKMLTVQRRMHERICDLINDTFYQGKLRTQVASERTAASKLPPLTTPAVFVCLLPEDGSEALQTESGSRQNHKSAELTARFATHYAEISPKLEVGVITPYRAQASLIRRLIRDKKLPQAVSEKIKVGTVHSFQGAEADVIIWDLVDTQHRPIGRLYQGDTGSRLANVAISRAQGKLVIVGDPNVFSQGSGHRMVKHLKGIIANRFSFDRGNMISARDVHFS